MTGLNNKECGVAWLNTGLAVHSKPLGQDQYKATHSRGLVFFPTRQPLRKTLPLSM